MSDQYDDIVKAVCYPGHPDWVAIALAPVPGLLRDLERARGGVDICIFCDWTTPRDVDGAALREHIGVCQKHPLVKARAEIAELRAELDALRGSR